MMLKRSFRVLDRPLQFQILWVLSSQNDFGGAHFSTRLLGVVIYFSANKKIETSHLLGSKL